MQPANELSTQAAELLGAPLRLPCGVVLKNRLAKSAMSEGLGSGENHPTEALATLYERWARGGVGQSITGNVMIDRRAVSEPGNVVIEDESALEMLGRWAQAGSRDGSQLWVQLNHPGKQVPRGMNAESVGPSAVPFRKDLARFFATPRELTAAEIRDLIGRFGRAAAIVKKAGFGGVQIHGAHGYLVSQFLSPHHNRRTDEWGGDCAGRRHFVVEVLESIRAQVGAGFPVGIKLNSADFQRGGFSEEESLEVIEALDRLHIDQIEISGGNYEAPVMTGTGLAARELSASTREREAYFLAFAEKVRTRVKTPLMVTGGFRSARAMVEAVRSGAVDVVGLGRPLAIDAEFPNKVLSGMDVSSPAVPLRTGIKALDRLALLEVSWYQRQIKLMARGQQPRPNESLRLAALKIVASSGFAMLRMRRLRA